LIGWNAMKHKPLTGIALYLMIFSLGLVAFVDGLDFSIANVAIPNISATFGNSPQQGTWVITLFAVSNAIVLSLSGWLAARFGSVKLILCSIALFVFTSLMCGLSWSFNSLLFFRIVQGASAGPLMTLPQSLVLENAPQDKKDMASGFVLLLIVLAPILGPFFGGLITELYGWPWIFFINVPLGVLAFILVWRLLLHRDNIPIKTPIDVLGILFLVIGVSSLQVFLDRGNDEDWFGSTEIIILAITASLGIIFFIFWNMYSRHPLIEFRFFRDRNFTLATIMTMLPYLLLGGTTILIPLWTQTSKGYTPFWAGVAVMPMGILPIVMAPMIAGFMNRFSLRIIATFGFIIFALSSFWFSSFTSEVSLHDIMLPRFVQGAGIALCFLPLFQIALSGIKTEDLAKATGLHNFLRTVGAGAGISTAIYVTTWVRRGALHHSDINEVLHPLRQPTIEAYYKLSEVGFDNNQIAFILDQMVTQQAYVMAFNDLFWLSGWILILSIPLLWFCKETRGVRKELMMME
jgi:DHA2 family multidrug resistance protein